MSQSRVAEEGEVGGWGNSVRVELVSVPAPGSTTRFIPTPPAAHRESFPVVHVLLPDFLARCLHPGLWVRRLGWVCYNGNWTMF